MRRIAILFSVLLIANPDIFGQTRTITGKVIREDLELCSFVVIQNAENLILGTTDIKGEFKLEIPDDTKTLIIGGTALESASINISPDCNQLDIVLLMQCTYDYITLKKVDKLRMKRFKKLPELHLLAYQKGLFTTVKPCYDEIFIPDYIKGLK